MEQSMLVMTVGEYTELLMKSMGVLIPVGFVYCIVIGLAMGAGQQVLVYIVDLVKSAVNALLNRRNKNVQEISQSGNAAD